VTAGQGLWIAILLTILVVFIVVMLLLTFLVLRRLAKSVTEVTESVRTQVDSVTTRAHAVIDQAQSTVENVTCKVAAAERALAVVAGAVAQARMVGAAKRVAKSSAVMASKVATGVTAGLDTLLKSDRKGKDES